MERSNPPPALTIQSPWTVLWDAASSPAGYTDLDLSAVVGLKTSLVLLRVKNNASGGNKYFAFRRNGDSTTTGATNATTKGINVCWLANNELAYVICVTDINGIIEWDTQVSGACIIALVAYINQQ